MCMWWMIGGRRVCDCRAFAIADLLCDWCDWFVDMFAIADLRLQRFVCDGRWGMFAEVRGNSADQWEGTLRKKRAGSELNARPPTEESGCISGWQIAAVNPPPWLTGHLFGPQLHGCGPLFGGGTILRGGLSYFAASRCFWPSMLDPRSSKEDSIRVPRLLRQDPSSRLARGMGPPRRFPPNVWGASKIIILNYFKPSRFWRFFLGFISRVSVCNWCIKMILFGCMKLWRILICGIKISNYDINMLHSGMLIPGHFPLFSLWIFRIPTSPNRPITIF